MANISEQIRSSLEAALSLFEDGFRLIPLGSPDLPIHERFMVGKTMEEAKSKWPKTPLISWKDFQQRFPTIDEIHRWAIQYPGCNWAILTGPEVVVVDADSEAAVTFMDSGAVTRTPWRVKTAKGVHYYFQANPKIPVRNGVNAATKLDIRGHGGYVVAAGSVHAAGSRYEWVRDLDQAQMIMDLPMLGESDWHEINGFGQNTGGGFSFDVSMVKAKASGAPVHEGGRNNAAASLAGQYIRAGMSLHDIKAQLSIWNSTNEPPLPRDELDTTIASVARTAVTRTSDATIPIASPIIKPKPAHPKEVKLVFPDFLYEVPGFLGNFVEHVLNTARKRQPIYAINAAVALGGAIAGQRYKTATGLRLNNYVITCGPTASGKEHPRSEIKKVLRLAGLVNRIGGEELASGAGLVAAVRRSPSIVFQLDEFGLFLQAVSGRHAQPHHLQIMNNLMKMHSAAQSIFTTTEYADQRVNKMEPIYHPCVTIHATTTPQSFFSALGSQHVLSGFLNRFLVVETESPDVRSQRPIESNIDDETLAWCKHVRGDISEDGGLLGVMPESPILIPNTDGAWHEFEEFEDYCEDRLKSNRESGLDALYGRAWEHAAKVSAVMALSKMTEKDIPPEVTAACAKWGIGYVKHCVDWLAAKCGAEMGDNQFEIVSKKILGIIVDGKHEGVPKSQLLKKSHLKSRELDEILYTLSESELIVQRVIPSIRKPKTVLYGVQFVTQ